LVGPLLTSEEPQHGELSLGERGQRGPVLRRAPHDQRLHDLRVERRAAAAHRPQCRHEPFNVVGNSGLLAVLLMLMLIVLAIPFRAVTAWTYNRTGSLFIVGFIHAAGNAAAAGSGFGESFLKRLYPGEDFVGITHLLAFALIGIVVIAATRARLGSSQPPSAGRPADRNPLIQVTSRRRRPPAPGLDRHRRAGHRRGQPGGPGQRSMSPRMNASTAS
jgi:hypothetical protein